jgi:glycosyltransferase involved in cell wall biosynthesis
MRPLSILHVVPYYEDAWAYGGIPRLAAAMTRGLARRGHSVTVCTTDAAEAGARLRARRGDGNYEGVRVRVFRNLSNHLAYRWQFFTPVGLRRFLRATAASFDVAHLHACHHLPGAIAASALRRARVPYVLSPNGTAPRIERRRVAKLAFDLTAGRGVLTGASRVLGVTAAERRQFEALGIAASRIRVVPNPIDLREFEPPPDGAAFRAAHGLDGSRTVLYLGKLTPRKGVDVLVRAVATLTDPAVRLVIAGNDMGVEAGLAALARELGVADRVVRVDLLRGRDRLDALAAADVVVYPSRDEIFGLVAVEALLCERPVVVCGDSGCGEIIGTVGGGDIVPFGDSAALARAIASVLADSQTWRARVRMAARRARELFSADRVCGQIEHVYGELVEGRAEAAPRPA